MYVTWSDLVQLMIALSTTASMIIALIALLYAIRNNNKNKRK